ncbi:MAG: AraC family transcriptional regulator [Pseudomonadaceae bacterium]|uniref:AraC family transcriptional regulator n=1 Tax=Pseudomonas marincola TaxID=437900 RepID=A0A653E9U3_9PSED|nr:MULTISPECIES: AraC family transcriptional regulator [Pseudomonas]MBQ53335.1 AraC family transcriptional regulator [Pseudomonadaceae bacterium]NRH29528.1 AraC family transcriptional regulator [Pseudomonas sp. MS19]CAE6927855.1 AraC family transcriptional regulator [Pseudomonas marincola]
MSDISRASSLARFYEFAQSQGIDPYEILSEVGLPRDIAEHPEELISYRKFTATLQLSAQRSANPLFGLQYGLFQGVSVFGPLLYLIRNTSNVGQALHELAHYYHLHSSAAQVVIEVHGNHATLSYTAEEQSLPGQRQAAELAMGVGHQLMRTLIGNRWQPETVMFQHAPGAPLAMYRRMLGATLQFNSTHNAWLFDSRFMNIPLETADAELHRLMRQHVDTLERVTVDQLPDHVQRVLRNLLPKGRVTVEQVAEYLVLSPRSLQRYLANEGTSFKILLDETRQAMARRYLSESTISFTQLAGLLGYSDLSAFSRAFQNWFDMSPTQWQKSNRQADTPNSPEQD